MNGKRTDGATRIRGRFFYVGNIVFDISPLCGTSRNINKVCR